MAHKFLALAVSLTVLSFMPSGALAQESEFTTVAIPTAESLTPPPLPKLEKGEWKPETTVFSGALNIADKDGNLLDIFVDLPGTRYSAHLEYRRHTDNPDDDLMDNTASSYDKALVEKGYDYQAALPGSAYHVAGAMADSSQGGVAGDVVIFGDKLRFVAIATNESGGTEGDEAEMVQKDTDVSGDIAIFISDEIPLSDVMEKVPSGDKKTSGQKQ